MFIRRRLELNRFLVWVPVLAFVLGAGACGNSKQHKPETLTIAFSNDVSGVIRACGCATNDFGGMGRRATFTRTVEDSTGNFLLVDAGDFFAGDLAFGPQKAEVTMRSMVMMGYNAVVIGEKELGLGLDFFLEKSAEVGLPVIVSNLRYAETEELLFPPSKIVSLPTGLKVGLIGVISPQIKLPPQIEEGTLVVTDPFEAVKAEIAALGDSTELIVLLAHVDRREIQVLAQRFPGIDIVILGHEGRSTRKVRKHGNAYVLQVAKEGRTMGTAFMVLDKNSGIRSLISESTQLSKRFGDDEAIVELFRSFGMRMTTQESVTGSAGH